MSKSSLAIAVVIVTIAVGIGYWSFFGSRINPSSLYKEPTSAPSISPPTTPPPPAIQVPGQEQPESAAQTETNTITYTDAGFSPELITVKAGTTVTFVNNSSSPFRPSSNPHPIHTDYPETSTNKCGESEAINMFDSCTSVAAGSSWLFTFNEVGTWGYHDHRNPGNLGTVIVTK